MAISATDGAGEEDGGAGRGPGGGTGRSDGRKRAGGGPGGEGRSGGADRSPHCDLLPESVRCPHCGETDSEQFSAFGSAVSVSQFYCRSCRTVFEYFKWR